MKTTIGSIAAIIGAIALIAVCSMKLGVELRSAQWPNTTEQGHRDTSIGSLAEDDLLWNCHTMGNFRCGTS